jgi:putative CocE/NonD family hydrolase
VLAWGRQRSPSTYLKALNQRKPPVYLVQNFQDELFHPNPVLDFFTRFKGPKRLDLNKGTHGSAELSGILGLNNHLWRQTHAWFDHWLKGDDNRVMEQAPITCQFARHRGLQLNLGTHEGDRQSLGDWQPTRANMTAYHLLPTATGSATGALAPAPGPLAAHNAIYSGPGISKTTAGIPLVSSSRSAHLNMPLKLNRARIRPKHTLVFESASFQQRMCILGTGQLTLHLECSRPQMQLVAYLYEVDADGHGRLVTHGPMTRHEVQTNTPMEITFELMTTCYEIEAGHHLLLAIDTSDMQYQRPTRDEFKVTFHYGGAHRAELAIPLVHAEDTGLKD